MCLDTTGDGLHKRGYRPAHNAAPLKETLAAAMVSLAHYRGREEVCDPFCGSGTIPIEAALTAKNRAPGLERSFQAMQWPQFPADVWEEERELARSLEFHGDYRILGTDIDPKAIEIARENARRAGVDDVVQFEVADVRDFSRNSDKGLIITNPPYGERLMERTSAEELYQVFGERYRETSGWDLFLLSSHPDFERFFGQPADKKRKLYNGMIPCNLYMYRRNVRNGD